MKKTCATVIIALMCLMVLVGPLTVTADNWPMYQHDAARSGTITDTITPFALGYWQASLDDTYGNDPILSSPAVYDGVVYVGNYVGNFYAVNATNGSTVWEFSTDNSMEDYNPNDNFEYCSPCVANGLVYVGTTAGYFYALNTNTGACVWYQSLGYGIYSSPCIANGLVYIGCLNQMFAFNAETGTRVWAFVTIGTSNQVSTPSVSGGYLYFGAGDGYIYCLNAATGAEEWCYSTGASFLSAPLISNGVVYFGNVNGQFYALNASNGAVEWTWQDPGGYGFWYMNPVIYDGQLFTPDGDGMLYALNAENGDLIWSASDLSAESVVVAGNILIVSADWRGVLAVDPTTHNELWSYNNGVYADQPCAVSNGVAYFGGNGYYYNLVAITGPPTTDVPAPYMSGEPSTTVPIMGTLCEFNVAIQDDFSLIPNGYFQFGSNLTGTWTWDAPESYAPAWVSSLPPDAGPLGVFVEKLLDCPAGSVIDYEWNFTNWAGIMGSSGIQNVTVLPAPPETKAETPLWIINDSACIGFYMDPSGPYVYDLEQNLNNYGDIISSSVVCLNAVNGHVIWNNTQTGLGSVCSGGLIFGPAGSNYIYAEGNSNGYNQYTWVLNEANGNLVYNFSGIVSGAPEIVTDSPSPLLIFFTGAMQSPPAETGQVAFSPTGTEAWLWNDTADEISFYAAVGNCVYAYDGFTSIIYCIDCGTGTTVWTATVPMYFDMMYSNDAGTVLCYDEQPYTNTTWSELLYSFSNPTVSNATTLFCNITAPQDASFAYFTGVFDDGAALVLNESTNGNGCYNFICANSTSCISVPYYTGYPLFSATPCYCPQTSNNMYGNILFAWSPATQTMYALTSAGALIQLNMPFFDWSTAYSQEMLNNKQYLGITYANAEGTTEGLAMYSIADLNLNEASPSPTPTPPPSPTPTPSPSPTPTSTPTPPLNTTVYSGGAGGPLSQTSSPSTQPSKAPAAGFASLSPLIQGMILTFAIIVVLAVCAAAAKNLSQRKIPQGKRRYFFAEVVR